MEEQLSKMSNECKNILGKSTDSLIIAHREGQCGATLQGDASNIAQSIFALIHDAESNIGQEIYKIIKLIAMNIANNPTPYQIDFVKAVYKSLPEDNE